MDLDVLGAPYECQTIDLGEDDEGPVRATLVRRRADRPTGRAVLYLHGFTDYFFQTHLAEFFTGRGWDFYALDLRKYGRSLLPHQTPNFCRDLADYFPELEAASHTIRADGNRKLLVVGHSTGGLIAVIWAHTNRDTRLIDGIVLNSPFFDFNLPWLVRRPLMAALCRLGDRMPYRVVRAQAGTVYGQSLHVEHHGEWNYNLAWKPLSGFPVRLAWLAAIQRAQRRLRSGLDLRVPILVACSTRSFKGKVWHESAAHADAVLDVEHMARWAPRLGRHVTLIRFDGGKHDLTLSGPAVRERFFTELGRWMDAYLGRPVDAVADADAGRMMQVTISQATPSAAPAVSVAPTETGDAGHAGRNGVLAQTEEVPAPAAPPIPAARPADPR